MTIRAENTDFDGANFRGAKLMLFIGDRLAVILRDDKPDIPWPDYWDFPGGERDPGETPETCALRETFEELSLHVDPAELVWKRSFLHPKDGTPTWFFAAHLPETRQEEIELGDEGQRWTLMNPAEYMAHPKAIPHFADRLRIYLTDCDR